MICPHCGCENKEQAKFCNECGMPLIDVHQAEPAHPAPRGTSAPFEGRSNSAPFEGRGTSKPFPVDDGGYDSYAEGVYEPDAPLNDKRAVPEFDFSPIDDEGAGLDSVTARDRDDGSGEQLVGSDYRSPAPKWQSGDTMELPPIEDDLRPAQQQFRAPDPVEKKGRRRTVVLAIVFILVIAGLGIGAYMYLGGTGFQLPWGAKSLPDVVGMNKDDATQMLQDQGFSVKVMLVKSDDIEDIVLLMDPGAGRKLSDGSEVVLQVATPRVVPDVVGKTQAEAQDAFTQEGFDKVEFDPQKSDEPEGTVLSVDPAAGQKAKAATPIKVAVAQSYTVPDTTGMGIDDATALLEQEGFIVNVVTVYTDDSDEGTVLSSDPEAGTKLKSGSAVTVSVAKSRASELVAATQAYLDGLSVFQANNTSYELVGYSDISYIGSNTTTAAVTVVAYTTLPDGETVYGAQKAGTVTLAWSNDDTQPDTMSLQLS